MFILIIFSFVQMAEVVAATGEEEKKKQEMCRQVDAALNGLLTVRLCFSRLLSCSGHFPVFCSGPLAFPRVFSMHSMNLTGIEQCLMASAEECVSQIRAFCGVPSSMLF